MSTRTTTAPRPPAARRGGPACRAALRRRVRALYGFSRGTQATLSVAQPLLGALLADASPPPWRLAVLVASALSGYFAVFALNDLLDARLDRQRFAHLRAYDGFDLDSTGGRHPLACGRLSLAAATAWVVVLGALTLTLVALLGPLCLVLAVLAAGLEAAYCALATVTAYKFLVTGVMVGLGGALGWIAVTGPAGLADDRAWLLLLFTAWLAAWEIGGRNVVNDFADVEEDVHLGVRTLPVVHGHRVSAITAGGCLLLTAAIGAAMMLAAWPSFGPLGLAGAVAAGWWALVLPGVRLLRDPAPPAALAVFNRASFYPALVTAAALAGLAFGHLP